MILQQTFEQLAALRLHAMARAMREQLEHPAQAPVAFEERMAWLVDAEWTQRQQKGLDPPTPPGQIARRRLCRRHRPPTSQRFG